MPRGGDHSALLLQQAAGDGLPKGKEEKQPTLPRAADPDLAAGDAQMHSLRELRLGLCLRLWT